MKKGPIQQKREEKAMKDSPVYDFVSLGSGSAGMAGAIYAARFNLKTLVIGSELGGTLNETDRVENYPGFTMISGIELMQKFREQAEHVGVKFLSDLVIGVKKLPDKDGKPLFEIQTEGNGSIHARTILYALGSKRRLLDIPGEKDFAGRGVSYCAICDAPFYTRKTVGIVGGSDSACLAALIIADHAAKTFIIYRKDKLRGEPVNVSRVLKNPKITVIYNTNVLEIKGDKLINTVILDSPYKGKKKLDLDGLFVQIGSIPNNEFAKALGVQLDQRGHIIIDKFSQTNVRGIFAAGDIADGPMEQVITGVAEACIASQTAHELLKK
ncbi:MAG: FAD-dependent oxidoreductase [Nanoarchaeota archaeon]